MPSHVHRQKITLLELIRGNHAFMDADGIARIAAIGILLGTTLTLGIILSVISITSSSWSSSSSSSPSSSTYSSSSSSILCMQMGMWLIAMSVFHLLEFYVTVLFHPSTSTSQAFLLNHSKQ